MPQGGTVSLLGPMTLYGLRHVLYMAGGHTKGASYRFFMDNARSLGVIEAVKIVRFEYECIKAVHAFAREHSIDCDSRELESVDVVYDQGQWDEAVEAIGFMRNVMEKDEPAAQYKLWSSEETEKRYLTPGALGAISYAAGSLSAYKLVVGILKLGLAKGLNLQTNTPATTISRVADTASQRRKWIVETPRGSIAAENVVLTTNGYTAHLYPALQGVIVPLRGHITAHRPGSGMPTGGLPTTYSFIYDNGYEYMIPRPPGSKFAGDIVIGGGLTKAVEEGLYEYGTTDDTTTDPRIIDYLKETTITYFGDNWGEDNKKGRIRQEWSGIMGYSADGFPLIGHIPGEEGLSIAASFQGHGMVLCFLCAKALTEILLGADDKQLDPWFPRAFRMRKERLQKKFEGRLHVKAAKELEVKSQLRKAAGHAKPAS